MRFLFLLILVPIIGNAQVEQVKWDTVFTNNYGLYFEPNNNDIYYHDGMFKKYSKEGKFVDGVNPLDAIYMGDVGIGTTTPFGNLHLFSETVSEGDLGSNLLFGSNLNHPFIANIQTGASPNQLGLAFYTHSSSTNSIPSSQAMRIDGNGFTSIGTAAPDAKLDIQGTGGGVLIPRLSTANLVSVIGDESELIYNTDDNQFQYWDGSGWIPLLTGATAIPVGMTLNTETSAEPDFTVPDLTLNTIATHTITPQHTGEELIYTVSGSVRYNPMGTNAALIVRVFLDGTLVTSVNAANGDGNFDSLKGYTYIFNGVIPVTSTSHTLLVELAEAGSGIAGVNTYDNQLKFTEIHRTGTKTF